MIKDPDVIVREVELVDDIPLIFAVAKQLSLVDTLSQFSTHKLRAGELTTAEIIATWLLFIISQSDHRLNQLQPWVEEHLHLLEALFNKPIRPLDFHDDRLADILDVISNQQFMQNVEIALNQDTIRVYQLSPNTIRLDATTASSYRSVLSDDGIIQFGHNKDDNGLPILKIALATLDPIGLPISTLVVSGNTADDNTYLPQIEQVQKSFHSKGKLFVGDGKMGSRKIRNTIDSLGDYYLTPLTGKQFIEAQYYEQIKSLKEKKKVLQIVLAEEEQDPEKKPIDRVEMAARLSKIKDHKAFIEQCLEVNIIAVGYELDREPEPKTKPETEPVVNPKANNPERRMMIRSIMKTKSDIEKLDLKIDSTIEKIKALPVRKQGKKRMELHELNQAAETIIQEANLTGIITHEVIIERIEQKVQKYKGEPEKIKVTETYQIQVMKNPEEIEKRKDRLGFQVLATNHPTLGLEECVKSYRGQYQIERCFSQLKGQPFSLAPMYLQKDERIVGLVFLLSIALRMISLIQWQIKKTLKKEEGKLDRIYAGQEGRKTSTPSWKLILMAMHQIRLIAIEINGKLTYQLTKLSEIQQRILHLSGFTPQLYEDLLNNLRIRALL